MFNMVVEDCNGTQSFYDEPMLRSSIKELVVYTADGEQIHYWLRDVKSIQPTTLSRREWQEKKYLGDNSDN